MLSPCCRYANDTYLGIACSNHTVHQAHCRSPCLVHHNCLSTLHYASMISSILARLAFCLCCTAAQRLQSRIHADSKRTHMTSWMRRTYSGGGMGMLTCDIRTSHWISGESGPATGYIHHGLRCCICSAFEHKLRLGHWSLHRRQTKHALNWTPLAANHYGQWHQSLLAHRLCHAMESWHAESTRAGGDRLGRSAHQYVAQLCTDVGSTI